MHLDFTNYEVSSQRVARVIYESLAVEGGRQSYVLPNLWTDVQPSMGAGIFSPERLSKDALYIKRIAGALMSYPLSLKKKYTLSPYYIILRYTIPSKLIVTAKDSNSQPIEAYAQDKVRKLRIKHTEVSLTTGGQEYFDIKGINIGVPVNTAQPFGYTDPWPIDVLLSPPETIAEYIDISQFYHSFTPVSANKLSEKLYNNVLYGSKEALFALHDRLSGEIRKSMNQHLSLLKAEIHIGNGAVLYTEDNTQVKLKPITNNSEAVFPADFSTKGTRVNLDLYYAKDRNIIETKANVKNFAPVAFAKRNSAGRGRIVINEILRQFLLQHAPKLSQKETELLISRATKWLRTFIPDQISTYVSYDTKYTGNAIDMSKLQEATNAVADEIKEILSAAGLHRILSKVDKKLVDNLIALLIFAITTTYYAAANLWDYFMRAIEAEDPITGHKQWKYSVMVDERLNPHSYSFHVRPALIATVRIVCTDVDSGEEVVLTVPKEEIREYDPKQFRINMTTKQAAKGSKVEGTATLPARCVECHASSNLHTTYRDTDYTWKAKKPTKLPAFNTKQYSVYIDSTNEKAEFKLVHKSEILST